MRARSPAPESAPLLAPQVVVADPGRRSGWAGSRRGHRGLPQIVHSIPASAPQWRSKGEPTTGNYNFKFSKRCREGRSGAIVVLRGEPGERAWIASPLTFRMAPQLSNRGVEVAPHATSSTSAAPPSICLGGAPTSASRGFQANGVHDDRVVQSIMVA